MNIFDTNRSYRENVVRMLSVLLAVVVGILFVIMYTAGTVLVVKNKQNESRMLMEQAEYNTNSAIANIRNYLQYASNSVEVYKLNKDDRITVIETSQNGVNWLNADDVDEGKLRMIYSSGEEKLTYINATGMISDKTKVEKNTIFFKIPDGTGDFDESLYSAQIGAPMSDGENVKYEAYSLSADRISADVCIIYYDSSAKSFDTSSPIGVVENVYEMWYDDDGEVKFTIDVRTKDGSVTVRESEYGYFKSVIGPDGTTKLALQKGDIVRYTTNVAGYVSYLTILGRVDENGDLQSAASSGGLTEKFFFKTGYMYKRDGTQLVLVNDKSELTRDNWSVLDIVTAKNSIVMCEDIDGTVGYFIDNGSIEDMNGYTETGEFYPVFVHMKYGQPQFVVIYK